MLLEDFSFHSLNQALKIYLDLAYQEKSFPERTQNKLEALEEAEGTMSFGEALETDIFEKIYVDKDSEDVVKRYQLRLGNEKFPHMKMSLERVADTADFILSVDSHDEEFDKLASMPGYEQLLLIKEHNRKIKAEIEEKWHEEGLPTIYKNISEEREAAKRGAGEVHKILIVDDEPSIREILGMTFESHGYDVLTAKNGKDALNVVRDKGKEIDLCLLDIMMETMNGFEVVRILHSEDRVDFPIIFLTGMPPNSVEESLVTEVIYKPFDFEKLVRKVDIMLKE
jgi:CheY-like chemotaxis protein